MSKILRGPAFPGVLALSAWMLLLTCGDGLGATTTNRWTNAVSSVWSASTNWSTAQLPSTSFNLIMISNAGTKTVTVDSTTATGNRAIRALTISAPPSNTNTLLMTDLTNGAFTTSGSVNISSGAIVQITNSIFTPQNTFDVVAGTLVVESGGLLDTTTVNDVDLRVGRASGATGTVALNGGNLTCFALRVGDLGNSQGNVTINAGTLIASSVASLGEILNSPGSLTMISGRLIITNDIFKVGNLAAGTFNQSGGDAQLAWFSIADNSSGTVNFSGGHLTVTPGGPLDVTRVGNSGMGHFNISGGTIWLRGEFHVADSLGIVGSVLMTGGQLYSTNDLVAIGRYGIGDMIVTNATAWFTNTSVGRHPDAIGTLTVQNGGSVHCLGDLSIGRFAGSIGHGVVSGGLLSLTDDHIWVGREGVGDFTVSSGTVQAKGMYVGMSEDGTNTPQGTVILNGGTTLLSSNLVVGTSLLSTGQVTVLGGTLLITNAGGNSQLNIANGAFALNQGTVTADTVVMTNEEAQFMFSGGTLQARNMTVANGASFVVGDGINLATLQLAGGTYSFADGLVISSNATVTGCGTIIGSISNGGTLNTNCGPAITITSITFAGATATVFFTTVSGANHMLEFKDALTNPGWTAILPAVTGTGGVLSAQDTNATSVTRFYRVHAQ